MDSVQANRPEQEEVLTLNGFCYNRHCNSFALNVSLVKRVWVTYFSLSASGGKEKTKCFTPVLLKFHFRVEQTTRSIVGEHAVERVFTTGKQKNVLHTV